jgi:carboxylesterase
MRSRDLPRPSRGYASTRHLIPPRQLTNLPDMSAPFPVIHGAEAWSSPGAGSRARIGIIVSHGFTGNPVATRPLGDALAARGFAVEVVRLPGHGTDWRDMAKTSYADWRREIELTVERLRRGDKRVVIAGLSLGGTLALDIACARPKDVAGVVTINATILNRKGLIATMAPVLEKILPVVPAGAAGLVKNDIAKGGDEKAYSMVPARAGNSVLKELPRVRQGLESLETPVLVAYSPEDHSVPPENSQKILEILAGRDVKELRLERSYHLATLDFDFDVLVDEIAVFADRVGS